MAGGPTRRRALRPSRRVLTGTRAQLLGAGRGGRCRCRRRGLGGGAASQRPPPAPRRRARNLRAAGVAWRLRWARPGASRGGGRAIASAGRAGGAAAARGASAALGESCGRRRGGSPGRCPSALPLWHRLRWAGGDAVGQRERSWALTGGRSRGGREAAGRLCGKGPRGVRGRGCVCGRGCARWGAGSVRGGAGELAGCRPVCAGEGLGMRRVCGQCRERA